MPTLKPPLFEASSRLGGIVETVRDGSFIVECGPDGWVTEKPWARGLAEELGLANEIISSNDETRKTYILLDGELVVMPDGMRMMVPTDLDALDRSPLFSEGAKAAFRNEILRADKLRAASPRHDESVADFVQRHFGIEVLEKIGVPLLSGVFGGDVTKLSVRAVMAPFVAMEREHGSLILALQKRLYDTSKQQPIFTTLRSGTGTLIEAMVAQIPPDWVRLATSVTSLLRTESGWQVGAAGGEESFDAVMLAVPVYVARDLIAPFAPESVPRMQMETSSAVIAGFGFSSSFDLPGGFGFLVPPGSQASQLLAGTFVNQKFAGRAPEGQRLLRAFFGGATADRLLPASDVDIAALAFMELESILGPLPAPVVTVVRRWPRALPQYAVGHLERIAQLFEAIDAIGGLYLIGNGYRGVGLPDLIRDARSAARQAATY